MVAATQLLDALRLSLPAHVEQEGLRPGVYGDEDGSDRGLHDSGAQRIYTETHPTLNTTKRYVYGMKHIPISSFKQYCQDDFAFWYIVEERWMQLVQLRRT